MREVSTGKRDPERSGGAAARTCCVVCGSAAVRLDAVRDGGWLHLAECARCEHRWTWRGAEVEVLQPPRVATRVSDRHTSVIDDPLREVPSAA